MANNSPYQKIHVVINPASGKDEPIINTLNDVFHQHSVDWEVSITKKYGDATAQAKAAIATGADLVVGYGGDGTQHEIANAVMSSGSKVSMGILPGGTGNGFAREMGIPKTLRPAVEVLCTSSNVRKIDVAQVGDQFFIQRLYVGIEPEEQTSREMKDKYGVFAYAINMAQRRKTQKEVNYQVTFDGELLEFQAVKVYVVNSGMTGSGHSIMKTYAIDDGVLDAFVLDRANLETIRAATSRFLHLDTKKAHKYYRQGREITIDTDRDQPVWFDGEYLGRTPVTVTILPGALPIVVP
jgi:YegS/Rv2252/BmrU family lipid kinase